MEKTMLINLQSIDVVKNFVDDITQINGECDLISGRYVINAKSIMGIFSLDLTKSLQLIIRSEKVENLDALKKYEVSE